jgi:hypothetical protein
MKKVLFIGVWAVLAIPIAFIITILVHPFWRWFEKVSGIESFGHSGPAEWCYWLGYSAIVSIGVFLYIYIAKRQHLLNVTKRSSDGQPTNANTKSG